MKDQKEPCCGIHGLIAAVLLDRERPVMMADVGQKTHGQTRLTMFTTSLRMSSSPLNISDLNCSLEIVANATTTVGSGAFWQHFG